VRVVVYQADDPDSAEAQAYLKSSVQQVVSLLEAQPGFRQGYWGRSPADGRFAAFTYWADLASIEAAVDAGLEEVHRDRAAHGFTIVSEVNVQMFAVPPAGLER